MTDAITDAVKRLKELQQDVERLKSNRDQRGQPRVFFVQDEQARSSDSGAVRQSGQVNSTGAYNARRFLIAGYNNTTIIRVTRGDQTATSDSQTVRNRGVSPRTYGSAFYSPALLFRDTVTELSAGFDAQTDLRSGGRVKDGTYGSSGFGTRAFGVADIRRQTQTETTACSDAQTDLRATTITPTGAYGAANYQTAAYNN